MCMKYKLNGVLIKMYTIRVIYVILPIHSKFSPV